MAWSVTRARESLSSPPPFVRSFVRSLQPRTFVPRALLYNDGGFDVSPDGKVLCACAEYWLPDGVENAMELLHQQEDNDESDDENDGNGNGNGTNAGQGSTTSATTTHVPSSAGEPPQDRQTTNGSPPPPLAFLAPPPPQLHNPPPSSRLNNPTTPQTPPPSAGQPNYSLSPPSPPGRRFAGGLGQFPNPNHPHPQNSNHRGGSGDDDGTGGGLELSSTAIPPPPPPPGINHRPPPNPFSILNKHVVGPSPNYADPSSQTGRYVPHVVTISLDTSPVWNDLVPGRTGNNSTTNTTSANNNPTKPHPRKIRPRLGQLLEACPLDGAKASAVTCVKFSPSTNFCLIGYGVREPLVEHNGNHYHPVTALYRVKGGMTHVSTMLSGDDDVNIARFHPDSAYGFVYGTKQGRVRVLSPRPWNYYNC
jgi:hypothetical protein